MTPVHKIDRSTPKRGLAVVWVPLLAMAALITTTAPAAEHNSTKVGGALTDDNGALSGVRHRVIVSTDIGGTDPDDFQSMVHILLYADVLDIEGLISSPYGRGRRKDILTVIDCYANDYANLKTHSDNYPTPDVLRAITWQGEIESSPLAGFRQSTEGSQWIVECARRDDPRPLHVLVWGGLEDLAQALHDAPDILPRLRVYWIGGPNKKWGPGAYQYLVDHHPSLWMIEANSTYRGWFVGGNQSGEWGNAQFVKQHVAGRGALGDFFNTKLGGTIKMGDSPSVGWLLAGVPEDPTKPGWGGSFVRAWERPCARFNRLTTKEERIEIFGILELALPLGDTIPADPEAWINVENQTIAGEVFKDGTIHFAFCPKAARTYTFQIKSNVLALDGRTGAITSFHPPADVTRRPTPALSNWWADDPNPDFAEGEHRGARTVSEWREAFLTSFAERMNRCNGRTP